MSYFMPYFCLTATFGEDVLNRGRDIQIFSTAVLILSSEICRTDAAEHLSAKCH